MGLIGALIALYIVLPWYDIGSYVASCSITGTVGTETTLNYLCGVTGLVTIATFIILLVYIVYTGRK